MGAKRTDQPVGSGAWKSGLRSLYKQTEITSRCRHADVNSLCSLSEYG
ncbi:MULTISPECIES: hypothetical protein [Paenibacillus]|nr:MULTISPECIES: hypothetical protein [Paenibacillus]MBE7679684.1 hypothetical protein [Paenibacillus sp. P13VS]MBY0218236.1 hypothetical protein [Paenibacillus illinoisensis]WJH30405.1 hypothetical protein N6H13_07040 [Paenibacillus sp. CC-CFT742]